MREVLGSAGTLESSALRVIDAFDEAMANLDGLDALTATAHKLSGHAVGLRDELNDRQSFAGEATAGDRGAAIAALIARERVRGRDATLVRRDGGDLIVSSIETSAGRVGSCWLESGSDAGAYTALDHLVAERLAKAATQNIIQTRNELAAELLNDDRPIEELLSEIPSELRLAEIARRLRVDLASPYRAIAFSLDPPGAISTVVLGAEVQRALIGSTGRSSVRAAPLQRMVAALVVAEEGVEDRIEALAARYAALGVTIRAGISDPVALEELSVGWRQAKEALALHGMAATGTTLAFGDLGALQLLRHIRLEQLMESSLFRRISEVLPDARTPSSIELLEVFLDEGSLRKAGAKVFLHHTTVETRIRRIEQQLGVDLGDPRIRFELQLVIKAARVVQFSEGRA